MKREARQAVHSLYRLFSRAALQITFRREEAEPLAPVLPPAWVGADLAGVLQDCADVAMAVAEQLKAGGKQSREAWLYVRALSELLARAAQIEREASEVSEE